MYVSILCFEEKLDVERYISTTIIIMCIFINIYKRVICVSFLKHRLYDCVYQFSLT